ncbi:MAG: glutamate synthase large subunit [Phycisphaerae bacterium]|nr:glutamate synthase large subunit [Phycisphaerae bacterium]
MTQATDNASGLYDPRWEHDACGIGAVINVDGQCEHRILELGNQVLLNLQHRGAAGADEATGDGAGVLFQVPHAFFAAEADRLGFALGDSGGYGVAMVFAPRDDASLRAHCHEALDEAAAHYGLGVLGWREVPGDRSVLGAVAAEAEPHVAQCFIDAGDLTGRVLENRLYMIRRRAERLVRQRYGQRAEDFYVASLSARTICYKGMFYAPQLFGYYPDLSDERMTSALAVVHQRYSTNTFPNWRLAQPFRMIAHNGEINTLSGNRNRMRARQRRMGCPEMGRVPDAVAAEARDDLLDVLTDGLSDSAQFDQCLELLVRSGRSLPHALMMMVPEAFGPLYHMSTDKRSFYDYHAAIMEPWDGPAALVITDGRLVGGTLDRNGLRPARYVTTTDGLVVLASEVGVIDMPPERIARKGRLQPGRMFLVDTVAGRLVVDNEIKSRIARRKPYRRWLEEGRIELRGLFEAARPQPVDAEALHRRMRAFGWTREELRMIVAPMATDAQEPIGSMGTDTPLAVLSDTPTGLFNYFKQRFAQVTNPPIDPYREGLVMSLMHYTGKRGNILTEGPEHCRQLKLSHPILTNEDVRRLVGSQRNDFRVATIEALFDATRDDPTAALRDGLATLLDAAVGAIADGASLLVVSDANWSETRAPIPSLLATAALHHGLLRRDLRGEAGLVIASGEPREVAHMCLLLGYGANAVNPYLLMDSLDALRRAGDIPETVEPEQAVDNVIAALRKGILKTMSKMGISTLRSYRSAQIFECIGLDAEVIDAYFPETPSRVRGIGLGEIAAEALARHRSAIAERRDGLPALEYGGQYHYRRDGENHLWNPESVTALQRAVRDDDPSAYARYARAINDQSRALCTLRGLFAFDGLDDSITSPEATRVPLEEVESAADIVKRFYTGAMSHGSISAEAHETMAVAMNRLGTYANTGEGGEDPARYVPDASGDSRNCGIKQVASARFGVTMEYLAGARMVQIKMAQGAKPGEGGQLPGSKVTEEIARLRHSTPGVSLISPPPHHDIYSIEDLAQLIYDLKCANPGAEASGGDRVQVSVKLVSEVGVGTIAAGVAKAGADEVLISGHDGGTGASPLSSIKHAGCPWELGLAETQQTLVRNDLRDRILVQADGQMKTGRDVVIGALLGAERFGFGTAPLVSLGCILMRKCHHGTCPVGIATQDPELRRRFAGKPEHVVRFMLFVAEEVRRWMAALGFRRFDEMVGRVERLRVRPAIEHFKARGLDFSAVFAAPDTDGGRRSIRRTRPQPDRLADHLDWRILDEAGSAIDHGRDVALDLPIRNVHRAVGTILSNRIVTRHGAAGLADGTVHITLRGSAGQSFGAFLCRGVSLRLIGDANDYVGKGLCGGRIIIAAPAEASFEPHENVIIGNTVLYGATSGELYVNGLAGERFAVRNSGATAVVEGVGDHGCEYMTGGTVVVLGPTGRNFAAGMSGGVAYVLDEHQLFDTLCNLDMVDVEFVWQDDDRRRLRELIERHHALTGSQRAAGVLERWDDAVGRFVKVMPIDYRNALEKLQQREHRDAEFVPHTEEVY